MCCDSIGDIRYPIDQIIVQDHIADADNNGILTNRLKKILQKRFKLLVWRTRFQNIAG